MFRKFLPKEFNFFDLYEKQTACAIEAAAFLKQIIASGTVTEENLRTMRDIEHKGDDVAHQIIGQLNKTFITPFDREDIYALAKELDDIIDMINTIVGKMYTYRVVGSNKYLGRFATMTGDAAVALDVAVKGMRNLKNTKTIMDACVEINRLENEGDSLRDTVMTELFEKEKDPIAVIKLKEIYQDAETLLDICEDVAHVVESIMVKQA